MSGTLFDAAPFEVPPAEPAVRLSPDRRRTQRQAEALAARTHPLSAALGYQIRLHEHAAPADDRAADGRRCGNCRWRQLRDDTARRWPKCWWRDDNDGSPPRVTGGPGTDVRAWWPACREHDYGDTRLSPDAARWVPEEVDQ